MERGRDKRGGVREGGEGGGRVWTYPGGGADGGEVCASDAEGAGADPAARTVRPGPAQDAVRRPCPVRVTMSPCRHLTVSLSHDVPMHPWQCDYVIMPLCHYAR